MARHILATLALSLLACNGCNDGNKPPPNGSGTVATGSPSAPGAPAGGETIVHVEDDGKAFDVARGAMVTLKLASNSGTGYVWVPSQVDPNILAQQGDRTSEVPTDTPGAPKTDVYHFAAQSPGSTTLQLDLKRPFGSAPPARSVHFTVNVH